MRPNTWLKIILVWKTWTSSKSTQWSKNTQTKTMRNWPRGTCPSLCTPRRLSRRRRRSSSAKTWMTTTSKLIKKSHPSLIHSHKIKIVKKEIEKLHPKSKIRNSNLSVQKIRKSTPKFRKDRSSCWYWITRVVPPKLPPNKIQESSSPSARSLNCGSRPPSCSLRPLIGL